MRCSKLWRVTVGLLITSALISRTISQLKHPVICNDCSGGFCPGSNETCGCDANCEIYKDCCPGWRDCDQREPSLPGPYPSFQCHSVSVSADNPEYYWMVSECPDDWSDQEVESYCVGDRNDRGFPPVTDVTTGFVYRNEFCAACNGVVNVSTWGYDLLCDYGLQVLAQNDSFVVTEDVLAEYCRTLRFTIPSVNFQPRSVLVPVPVRSCYPSLDAECLPMDQIENVTVSEYNDLLNGCKYDVVQQLAISLGPQHLPYRNGFCALCNNFDILCFMIPQPTLGRETGGSITFSATLDILGDGRIIVKSVVVTTNITVSCSQSEVYNPVTRMCRQTLLCDGVNIQSCANSECNGSLLNLTRSKDTFIYLNSDTILYNGEVYMIEFNTSEGDPVICVNFSRTGIRKVNETINYYSYPQAYFILTYIGCSLSVIGSASILLTYSIFKDLRTLPSKVLMNLAFAILVSNLLILLGGPVVAAFPDVVELCVTIGVLLHFFFLSQFSWMSIMSLEMTRIFYQGSRLKTTDSKRRKCILLLFYLFIGWSLPLLITVITIIVNYTSDGLVLYGVLPDGSRGSCWINHIESAITAFVTPLAVSLIFNCTTFMIVSVLLWKASRTQAKLDKGSNISYFRVNVAVFSTSGLTWLFGFLAILAGTTWSWYPFIILNSTQGFIIFAAFLCTKRVAKLYVEKLTLNKEKATTTSSTKPTTIVAMKSTHYIRTKTSSVADLGDAHEHSSV